MKIFIENIKKIMVAVLFLYVTGKRCPQQHYKDERGFCKPMLTCGDIHKIKFIEELDTGYVKRLQIGLYNNMKVVYSSPRYEYFKDDFLHGLEMLIAFQQSIYVVDLIGYCKEVNNLMLVTKYMKHGSADYLNNILDDLNFTEDKQFIIRINLCLSYLSIIEFLHNSPLGVRVMCDSNDVMKTLSQFLITEDFRLVVADLDALPEVDKDNNVFIKCGHRQLFGDFVAPEQLWPYENLAFDDNVMPNYTEKVDVWKIPDVMFYLIGNSSVGNLLKFRVVDLFVKCKSVNPDDRPTVSQVRTSLQDVITQLSWKAEL